jgi:hypothetical protein
MVVLAVDGSRVEIPDSAENRREYGESENRYGKAVAQVHLPEIKEVVGEQPVLVIFDRNYSSLEFMNYLEKAGVHYLIRLHSGDYKAERSGPGWTGLTGTWRCSIPKYGLSI